MAGYARLRTEGAPACGRKDADRDRPLLRGYALDRLRCRKCTNASTPWSRFLLGRDVQRDLLMARPVV